MKTKCNTKTSAELLIIGMAILYLACCITCGCATSPSVVYLQGEYQIVPVEPGETVVVDEKAWIISDRYLAELGRKKP